MDKQHLVALIRQKKSFLCVGLDTDLAKVPQHLLQEEDPIFSFNKAIIDATLPYTVAYKPNLAFMNPTAGRGCAAWTGRWPTCGRSRSRFL